MGNLLDSKSKKVFEMYADYIKDYIYKNNWHELRNAQTEAGDILFNSSANLVISSVTASGKTEAAFFPILSILDKHPSSSVSVLYIAPTRALINDQFERISDVVKESGIPVVKWHSDASNTTKKKLLNSPQGILQITPESLESILLNHPFDLLTLFSDLRFIVFDEIHNMLSSDRGAQVKCSIERISRAIGYSPRVIALSATLGNIHAVADSITNTTNNETFVVDIHSESIRWKLLYEHFCADEEDGLFSKQALDYLYKSSKGKKSIIFSNSREQTEYLCSSLRDACIKKGETDRFYIHHGNLSSTIREDTERALKDEEKISVACATVTLELGIDIGKLDRIINVEAPNSVSSFLQRLGRSGRRNCPPEMLAVFTENISSESVGFFDAIPWHLLQMIAITELYTKERYIEPVYEKKYPFSLLFHQTLSILSSSVELTPKELANSVLGLSAFSSVSREDYRGLLISMIESSFIQQTEDKSLIIGLNGEKICESYKFYAVFSESYEYLVKCGTEKIGTVSTGFSVGESFSLAGKKWEVVEIDANAYTIHVKKSDIDAVISWPGTTSIINTKIIDRIKYVLEADEEYKYLSENALNKLKEARKIAKRENILSSPIVCLGSSEFVFFHWLGTKATRTLKKVLKFMCEGPFGLSDITSNSCYYIKFKMKLGTPDELLEFLKNIDFTTLNPENFVEKSDIVSFEKYDKYIPQNLLNKAFFYDQLDLPELEKACRRKFKNE